MAVISFAGVLGVAMFAGVGINVDVGVLGGGTRQSTVVRKIFPEELNDRKKKNNPTKCDVDILVTFFLQNIPEFGLNVKLWVMF
jgi:hypothetical protein